ncbi:MAG: NAD(P)/FAD-dependent oxidoreductase [Thermoplasmata archaeon]|nr:NAD(P)/FAD-dependent oxidoreductase [Thermoplasmata archaeon]
MGWNENMHDVMIIGAGPAGASAARYLDKAGVDHIIVDKSTFPRPKPCAGVLPPKVLSLIDIPEDIAERPLDGYRLFPPSGRMVESGFPQPGLIVDRSRFDHFLVKGLNAQILNEKVTGITEGEDSVKAVTTDSVFEARYLIGADGANSAVARQIGSRQGSVALAAQYEISLPRETIDSRMGNWFEVYYVLDHGYGWLSPMRDSVKAGVGVLKEKLKSNIRNELDAFLEHPRVEERIAEGEVIGKEAHTIPMSGPSGILGRDRTLLAGDAGGFVYPGTGEGIYYAMRSGQLAAEAVIVALESGDDSPVRTYESSLEEKGLLSLRDVDFMEKNLSSAERAEAYVRKLGVLAGKG